MDRSKYRNSDIPMRYSKKSPEFKYKEGIDIEGVHYTYAPLLFDTGIFQTEDCTGLSDFELSDTTDESDEEHNVNSFSENIIANAGTDDVTADEINSSVKKRKRGHNCYDVCAPSSSIPLIHIKQEKEEYFEKTKEESFQKRRISACCEKKKKEQCCVRRKKTKRAEKDDEDYTSESSIQSLRYQTQEIIKHERLRQTSTSFPALECNDVNIKDESMQSPQIFGYFFCEICNLDMSSEKVYSDHMNGKRHRKNLKLKYVDQAVAKAIPPSAATEGQSRYPKPPQGVIRRKIKQRAKIQDVIKYEVKKPCPGLNFVTEIRGLKETQYYCSLCNSICSPSSILSHLTGFKHQLNTLKHFRPGDYEQMSMERKNLVQDRIIGILGAIQKREGLGRMSVEVEEIASDSTEIVPYTMCQSSTSRDVRETSIKLSGMSFTEYYDRATIPDKTLSDFYCEYCDAHMNSEDMWQSHITGKRHITNLKKLPGDRPSKCKTIPLPNERAELLDRFEDECPNEPIVGLDAIREVKIRETNSASYNCFLCFSCHTSMDIVEHIVSLKHRKKYLELMRYPYMQFISGMSELSQTPIIRTICAELEAEKGRGTPSVHINKSAFFA